MKNNFSNAKQISDLKTLKNLLKNKNFSCHGVFDVIILVIKDISTLQKINWHIISSHNIR